MKKRFRGLLALCVSFFIIFTALPMSARAGEVGGEIAVNLEDGYFVDYMFYISGDVVGAMYFSGAYTCCYRIINDNTGAQIYPTTGSAITLEPDGRNLHGAIKDVNISDLCKDYYVCNNNAHLNAEEFTDAEFRIESYASDDFGYKPSSMTLVNLYLTFEGVNYTIRYCGKQSGDEYETVNRTSSYGTQVTVENISTIADLAPEGTTLVGWSLSPGGGLKYGIGKTFKEPESLKNIDGSYFLDLYPVYQKKATDTPTTSGETGVSGKATISMPNYYYGNTTAKPTVTSSTNTASAAVITYKTAGSADSTYTSTRPTAIGKYTVRAVLPATGTYGAVTVTTDFSISYMPIPNPGASADQENNENGWINKTAQLKAPSGYKISLRQNGGFVSSIPLEEGKQEFKIYYQNAKGEISEAETVAYRVDTIAPNVLSVESLKKNTDQVLFGKEVHLVWEELYPFGIKVNDQEVEMGSNSELDIPIGKKIEKYVVAISDEAGNETKSEFSAGPEWLMDRVIPEGDVYLEAEEYYKFASGKW